MTTEELENAARKFYAEKGLDYTQAACRELFWSLLGPTTVRPGEDAPKEQQKVIAPKIEPQNESVPLGVLQAIKNKNLTLLKTRYGYELRTLGPCVAQQAQQPVIAPKLSHDDIRAAGGIVHRDGNVFFTNVEQLNQAIKYKEDTAALAVAPTLKESS